ncbi:MAG TPA: hypothetical protein VGF59_17935, partial [Bryobacteraceae bacterium]
MSPKESIQELLAHKPGLKAQQIASELGLERSQVVAALHGDLGGAVTQDSAYRWWPKTRGSHSQPAAPRTLLANICRYYLECLARESGAGISIPAGDTAGYVELSGLPFGNQGPWANERAIRKLVQKVRRERGQLTLYVGYAIRLRSVAIRNDEERRIEPVLLYPIEDMLDERGELPRPTSGIPLFNLDVLKSLPAADSGNVMDEAIQLSEELGLANDEDEQPPWDEIVLRLQRRRPEWKWREALDPYALSQGPPLAELTATGIYNRVVLLAGTRSPFTYGLEIELRKLMQFDEAVVYDTALGA